MTPEEILRRYPLGADRYMRKTACKSSELPLHLQEIEESQKYVESCIAAKKAEQQKKLLKKQKAEESKIRQNIREGVKQDSLRRKYIFEYYQLLGGGPIQCKDYERLSQWLYERQRAQGETTLAKFDAWVAKKERICKAKDPAAEAQKIEAEERAKEAEIRRLETEARRLDLDARRLEAEAQRNAAAKRHEAARKLAERNRPVVRVQPTPVRVQPTPVRPASTIGQAQQAVVQKPSPKLLFFDTETTGLPKNNMYDAPASRTDIWPRLVQLAWIMTDEQGNVKKSRNYIIRPDGFCIPPEAAAIHRITTSIAMQNGISLDIALSEFLTDLGEAIKIVGHNISFDKKVVGAEMCRKGKNCNILMDKPSVCTMLSSTSFCRLPPMRYGEYKWPKLSELHDKLFLRSFEDAHDASADIKATKDCYFELVRRGIISK